MDEKNRDQAPVPGHASKTAQSVENKAGEDSADKNGKGTTGLQFGEGSENAAKDSGGGLLTDQVDWPEEDRKEMGFTGEKESGDSEKKEDTAAGGEQEEGKKKKTAAGGEKEEGKKKKTAAGGEKEEGKKKKSSDAEEKAQDRQIRLGFAGDLNLSEDWETTVFMDRQKNGIRDCFSPALLKEMRDFDLFVSAMKYVNSPKEEGPVEFRSFIKIKERTNEIMSLLHSLLDLRKKPRQMLRILRTTTDVGMIEKPELESFNKEFNKKVSISSYNRYMSDSSNPFANDSHYKDYMKMFMNMIRKWVS